VAFAGTKLKKEEEDGRSVVDILATLKTLLLSTLFEMSRWSIQFYCSNMAAFQRYPYTTNSHSTN
jgi:hypothetical protein